MHFAVRESAPPAAKVQPAMSTPEENVEGLRDKLSSTGTGALGDVAQLLLENPLFNQALHVAFGARDAASQAATQARKGLNVPASGDVERLGRRLRALSDRLEEVEDRLDELVREVRLAREARPPVPAPTPAAPPPPGPPPPGPPPPPHEP